MHEGPETPHYAISVRDPIKGWWQAKWKMTISRAQIQFGQYEGLDWAVIWPSEQFYREQDFPLVGAAAKFQSKSK